MHALVLFSISGRRLAVPLATVERVLPMVDVVPLPRAPRIALGVINMHGRVIPVVDAQARLGLPPSAGGIDAKLMVVRTARRLCAFAVDEILGPAQVDPSLVTPPELLFPGLPYLKGVARIGDDILLIEEMESFLGFDEEQQLADALGE